MTTYFSEEHSTEAKQDPRYYLLVEFLEYNNDPKAKELLKEIRKCKTMYEFRKLYHTLEFKAMLQVF